ncbi:hypothetical protein BB559_003778 [Furculomyces boomerangus]|uniref:Proteasome maturation factor UMP1 n=1 Tax=Furculomyces boomerangus TaxID=61424 RepID=A0A2T9YIU2_9FUNG|nr:hypothetical protein BB559_003778 [Furculomyces boomerangus]
MSENNKLNDFGVHDTIRHGPSRMEHTVSRISDFETHLKNIKMNELEKKLQLQKTMFGSHMPMRTIMELSSVSKPSRPEFMSPVTNFQFDILNGNDETLDVSDIFNDTTDRVVGDVHSAIIKNRNL